MLVEQENTTTSVWRGGVSVVFGAITIVYSNSPSVAPDLLGPYSLLSLAFFVAGAAVLARPVFDRELPQITIGCFSLAMVAWAGMSLISLLTSDVPGLSLASAYTGVWRAIGFAIILFLLIERIEQFRAALAAIVMVTVALASLTVLQYVLGLQSDDFHGWAQGELEQIVGESQKHRPSGPIGDPNYYGMYLIPGVLLCLHHAVSSHAIVSRLFFVLCSAIVVFAIALTASRGASVALVIGGAAWLAAERNAWKTITVVGIAAVIVLVANAEYLQRLLVPLELIVRTVFNGRSLGVAIDESSIFGRVSQLQASLILFLEHPITGVGFGQFESFFQAQTAQHNLLMRGQDRSAHNFLLEIAAEQGAMGLLGFFIFLVMLSKSLADASRKLTNLGMESDARLVRTFGYVVFSIMLCLMTLHDSHQLQLWVLFAIAFSANNVVHDLDVKKTTATRRARNMKSIRSGK